MSDKSNSTKTLVEFDCDEKNCPRTLFKYLSIERALQVLEDRTIRFTQPKYFNDPFEFCPILDMDIIKSNYLQHKGIEKMPSSVEERKAVMKDLRDFSLGFAKSLIHGAEGVGVLCLSAEPDIPLQWSHYASEHRGVVIGIRIHDEFLRYPCNRQSNGKICDFGAIEYRADRLRFPGNMKDPLHYMFVKDCCWSYEKEWRFVKSVELLRHIKNDVYVSDFESSAIRCIIRGLRTSTDEWQDLCEILKDSDYGHVSKFATQFESDRYGLDITTDIGALLDDDDLKLECYDYPYVKEFYRLTSKGELFKAMELIPSDRELKREKDSLDFS